MRLVVVVKVVMVKVNSKKKVRYELDLLASFSSFFSYLVYASVSVCVCTSLILLMLCRGFGIGSWYSKPESLGNSAGDKIQDTLSPVGKHAGPVLEKAGGPIGGIVDPTVGGIMRAGKGWGDQIGVGFGNEGGGPAKQQEAEQENLKKGLGGNEQNGENPLGL